mmetsp:Transcript_28262/g.30875  ORF Transcript_28262/g.30875 Transcript_28262/m.30875 type:complete len:286 (+) Transcript_28262:1473-2330(+)
MPIVVGSSLTLAIIKLRFTNIIIHHLTQASIRSPMKMGLYMLSIPQHQPLTLLAAITRISSMRTKTLHPPQTLLVRVYVVLPLKSFLRLPTFISRPLPLPHPRSRGLMSSIMTLTLQLLLHLNRQLLIRARQQQRFLELWRMILPHRMLLLLLPILPTLISFSITVIMTLLTPMAHLDLLLAKTVQMQEESVSRRHQISLILIFRFLKRLHLGKVAWRRVEVIHSQHLTLRQLQRRHLLLWLTTIPLDQRSLPLPWHRMRNQQLHLVEIYWIHPSPAQPLHRGRA